MLRPCQSNYISIVSTPNNFPVMSQINIQVIDNNIVPVIVPTSTWVMDCPNAKLRETCRDFLEIIDDLQGIVPPEQSAELTEYFNRVEVLYRSITNKCHIDVTFRNELRSIFKHIMQLCCIYNHQPAKIYFV
jgi:hypothetical protein